MGRWSVRFAVAVAAVVAAGCNESQLSVLPPKLSASPASLDFGRVLAGTTTSATITLTNVGGKALTVGSWGFTPAEPRFEVIGTSPAVTPPFSLAAGESIALELRFQPPEPGTAASSFVAQVSAPDAASAGVDLTGTGYLVQSEVVEQGTQHSADILFVVDNSGSMGDKQTRLADSFNTFINWLIGHTVSFHVGVTTTDVDAGGEQGALVGSPKILKNDTPNLVDAFNANVHVGTSGSATERGFDGANLALTEPMISGANAGFLRSEAKLYVVFVSDEDDQSSASVGYYVNQLTTVKDGDTSKIFFAAIAGDMPSGCTSTGGSAVAGARYNEIVQESAGLWGSICDTDFGVTLENLAFEITAPVASFPLAFVPDPSTIVVIVDGMTQPPDRWTLDTAANAIVFDAAWIPAMGASVEIHYDAIDTH